MKPDWKDAPKWAKWLAQDRCYNAWHWFEYKPSISISGYDIWSPSIWGGRDIGYGYGITDKHWQDTLERRPKEV